MSKDQEKHAFTTFDTFSVLGLAAGTIILIGSIVSHTMIDQKGRTARARSLQLAAEIAAGGYRGLQDEALSAGLQGRAPASVRLEIKPEGRIGMDPWGSPYYYKFVESLSGERIVTVLSSGPNRLLESIEGAGQDQQIAEIRSVKVIGDDLVAIIKR